MHAAQATMHATQATAQRNNHHLLKRTHFPRRPCLLVLFCSTFGTFYFRELRPPSSPPLQVGRLKPRATWLSAVGNIGCQIAFGGWRHISIKLHRLAKALLQILSRSSKHSTKGDISQENYQSWKF